ncbi:MAG: hypothetical protein OHK0015_43580 [Chloroflexi bacterium OHK40]
MANDSTHEITRDSCPMCGQPLEPEGKQLRCEEHGLFFRYGTKLLVRVARTASAEAQLLPWQTLQEQTVGQHR